MQLQSAEMLVLQGLQPIILLIFYRSQPIMHTEKGINCMVTD